MSDENKKPEASKAETNGKAAAPATPAAAPPPPPPPEHYDFGKFIESIGIKAEPLGKNASDTEMSLIAAKDILQAAEQLKKQKGMNYLSNMLALEIKEGYQVIYMFENIEEKTSYVLKVTVPKDKPVIPSIHTVYGCVDWLEREAYDMVGVKFEGHPDLRRILNPDDWEGFPLRKDYIGPIDALNEPIQYAKS